MNIHKNARLTPIRRAELVGAVLGDGQSLTGAAVSFGVTPKTASKWVRRFIDEGKDGLLDRSSRPLRLHRPTPEKVVQQVIALRRQRMHGKRIAFETDVSPATVSRILNRAGLSRMRDLDPPTAVLRYEYSQPGAMIHLDIKKLGRFERTGHRITGDRTGQSNSRGVGWEYVHVAIDDHSRIATSEILPNEKAVGAIAALTSAITFYEHLGIKVERVMTDNGSCYISHDFADACRELGLKHIRTKPYTPRTNGKAERFIKTAIYEWAYARAYDTSDQRAADLPLWLHYYNWHRPHGGINFVPPIQRLKTKRNNLLSMHN
ncbi:MAG: IS481 family transposase [Minwuia sp.]|nr:IS481 family transposase [Minwuia sp.]